jgi:hypothetical protein
LIVPGVVIGFFVGVAVLWVVDIGILAVGILSVGAVAVGTDGTDTDGISAILFSPNKFKVQL